MDQIIDFLRESFPYCERACLIVGGAAGAVSSFLFGADSREMVLWLLLFVMADWASGVLAACKTQTFSSAQDFVGILRKALLFAVVALCHGVDVACGLEAFSIEAICIGAYAINEAVSIIENMILLGYEKYIPKIVLRALELVKEEQEKRIDRMEGRHGVDKEAR